MPGALPARSTIPALRMSMPGLTDIRKDYLLFKKTDVKKPKIALQKIELSDT
jgi:hypothetical protein